MDLNLSGLIFIMDLFEISSLPSSRQFFDFALANDKAGALKHLQTLSISNIEIQVLESGFSMIGRHHGKSALMEYALNQVGEKTPVKRRFK
jgi:hypothetical protein